MSKKFSELYSRIKDKRATIEQLHASLAKEWRELDRLLSDLAIEAELEGAKGQMPETSRGLSVEAELEQMKRQMRAEKAIAPSPSTLFEQLKSKIESDQSLEVKIAAVKKMSRECHSYEAWAELKKITKSMVSGKLKVAAMKELAKSWFDNPQTLPTLQAIAKFDENWGVRRVATRIVAQGWRNKRDRADILLFLKNRAQSDEDSEVRSAALQEIAKGWRDDPNTLSYFKERIGADNNYVVKIAILEEMAKHWHDDSSILPLLKNFAESGDKEQVRRAALQEIAKGWHQDPETFSYLSDRAKSDISHIVRRAALVELVNGWNQEPEIFQLLRDRVLNDPFRRKWDYQKCPREAALEAIIQYYPSHSLTLQLLRRVAKGEMDEKIRKLAEEALSSAEKKMEETTIKPAEEALTFAEEKVEETTIKPAEEVLTSTEGETQKLEAEVEKTDIDKLKEELEKI